MELKIEDLSCMSLTLGSLEHYGVPGMKWGRRKARPTSGGRRSRSQKLRKGHAQQSRNKKVNVQNMSDKELRQRINRMQMEVQYKKLSTSKGGVNNFVSGILKDVARETVKNRISTGINAGIDTAANSAWAQVKKLRG